MPETITDITIANRALARIGAPPLAALDEDSDLARQVAAVYTDRIEALIALHPWRFAQKTYALNDLAQTAENDYEAATQRFKNGWRYGFTPPGTRLSDPIRVLASPRQPAYPLREFAMQAGLLYAERRPLWATFIVRVPPNVWLPAFRLAAIAALAADLAVPVLQNVKLAAELRAIAEGDPGDQGRGGLIGQALARDYAGAPIEAPLQLDPLTDARFA